MNLAGIMKKLSELVEEYHRSEPCEEKEKRYGEIEELALTYAYFNIIDKTGSEDSAGDFIISVREKLKNVIDAYEKEKGAFSSFINSSLFTMYSYFKKGRASRASAERLKSSVIEDGMTRDARDDELLVVSESAGDYEIAERACPSAEAGALTAGDRKGIIALMLRSVLFIDDGTADNVAEYTGYDQEYIRRLCRDGKTRMARNVCEMERHRELRNTCYLRKLLLEKKNAQSPPDEKDAGALKKYDAIMLRHRKKIESLSLLPHKDIAEMLGMEYSTVRGYIYRARKKLSEMSGKR